MNSRDIFDWQTNTDKSLTALAEVTEGLRERAEYVPQLI